MLCDLFAPGCTWVENWSILRAIWVAAEFSMAAPGLCSKVASAQTCTDSGGEESHGKTDCKGEVRGWMSSEEIAV